MSDYKEFLGKNLDAAISEACAYYDMPREKLEIDILEDAKSGIFGIVGARKARIRVRKAVPLRERADWLNRSAFEAGQESETAEAERADTAEAARPAGKGRVGERRPEKAAPENSNTEKLAPEKVAPEKTASEKREFSRKKPLAEKENEAAEPGQKPEPRAENRFEARSGESRKPRPPRPQAAYAEGEAPERVRPFTSHERDEDPHEGETLPKTPLTKLDQTLLGESTLDVVRRLVLPIVGEAPLSLEVTDERVNVKIDCEDTGLLIGRDGQNLAALQYLAARMITRRVSALVRVQLDAGDYHSRQDSRLRELALDLAERVRQSGKSQSSKPLSAYQRRVIHLTLQDDPQVQTRSSGEGMLKRVIVMRRKD